MLKVAARSKIIGNKLKYMNEELTTIVSFLIGAVVAKNWAKLKKLLPFVAE